jgi:signal transduction histidine kinase
MPSLLSRLPPAAIMVASVVIAVAMTLAAVLIAIDRPQLDLPRGAVPLQVGEMELAPTDLIAEPDQLGTYSAMRAFFDRQTRLVGELEAPTVTVTWRTPQGATRTDSFTPRPRTVGDLPFPFWFQQGVGIIALLVGGWVLSLRREDWGARMFALTAIFLPIAAMSASVYSTRQVALDGELFRTLSQINHLGAVGFGTALVGLFLMYPRPLVSPRWLLVPLAIFGTGFALDFAYVGDLQLMSPITMTQMLVAIVLGVIQWVRSRKEPVDRAGLRWFLLFSLIGCSLFISLSIMPPVLGIADEGILPQAYAFGFFNFMHVGFALGILRWRLFQLDRYAYYIWLWLAGALLIFAVDLVLLMWLAEQPWASLAIALLLGGFLYFPLRQVLLTLLFTRKTPDVSQMIPEVLDVALSPTLRLQEERWDRLLAQCFAPAAEIERIAPGPERASIAEDGLALEVPALGPIAARRLRYAAGGRRLFNTGDRSAAASLERMVQVVGESHLAYERGVNVERDRISRDVHDNIGAQLLSALHAAEGTRKDALLRDTLTDLRQIVSDGFGANFRLADVAADLRAEMADRLEVHGILLDWPAADLAGLESDKVPFLLVNTMRSILRESTSNIIKHAGAGRVQVRLTQRDDALHLEVRDDGSGFAPAEVRRGEGLNNMAERVTSLGGTIEMRRDGTTMLVHACLPLDVYSRGELARAAQ